MISRFRKFKLVVALLLVLGALLAFALPVGASSKPRATYHLYTSHHVKQIPVNKAALIAKYGKYAKILYLPRLGAKSVAAATPAGYSCWSSTTFYSLYSNAYVGWDVNNGNTLEAVAGDGPHEQWDLCYAGPGLNGSDYALYTDLGGRWAGANIYAYDLMQAVATCPCMHETFTISCQWDSVTNWYDGVMTWWLTFNGQGATVYRYYPYYLYGSQGASFDPQLTMTHPFNICPT
jgi:hypothetical protein